MGETHHSLWLDWHFPGACLAVSGVAQAPGPAGVVRCSSSPSLSLWILFRRSCYSQVSISAEASFPVVPKWILMNLPLQVKKMMLYIKLEAHSKRDWNHNTDSPLWHLKEHPSVTRDSQSERSCHSSRSWRCQRPPAGGWHWWSDPPESPAKAKAVLTSGAWECLTRQPTRWPGNLTHLHFAWSWFLLLLLPSDCNCCKVLDDTFRVHSLPSPGFSAVKQLSNISENLSSMTSETCFLHHP